MRENLLAGAKTSAATQHVVTLAGDEQAMRSRAPVVSFENVSLAFDDNVVLRDLSFTVPAGRMKILLGASGSGKSVILKLLLGLLKPDSASDGVTSRNSARVIGTISAMTSVRMASVTISTTAIARIARVRPISGVTAAPRRHFLDDPDQLAGKPGPVEMLFHVLPAAPPHRPGLLRVRGQLAQRPSQRSRVPRRDADPGPRRFDHLPDDPFHCQDDGAAGGRRGGLKYVPKTWSHNTKFSP